MTNTAQHLCHTCAHSDSYGQPDCNGTMRINCGDEKKLWEPLNPAVHVEQKQGNQAKDGSTWSAFVAGMVCHYLGKPLDAKEERAIAGIIERRLWALPAPAQAQQTQEPVETAELYGVKDGVEFHLGKVPYPPRSKAREIAISYFGHFEDDDGSDAELCFGALEQLVEWMYAQGFKIAHPAPKQAEQAWQPIETAPKVKRTNKPWDESDRVVVRVEYGGEVYAAFARYTNSLATGYEWNIEGHGGDWSNRVTGWFPLPTPPEA